jgi:hypothetical protein
MKKLILAKRNFDAYRIRDPIHGFICISDLEIKVINTSLFQRLRRIKQLALADLVYPGTGHSRFEHSLGVLNIASQIVEQMLKSKVIKKSDVQPIRLAALLHDLGHGPFSHISEYLLEKHSDRSKIPSGSSIEEIHEDITIKLIQKSDELKKILGSNLIGEIINIIKGNDIRKDIISGPLDADKLDYLMRDAHYAGVKYGWFDLSKILESMIPIEIPGSFPRLGIKEEGVHAVEQLVMAKHHMTVQVYRHRIRAITDSMIIRGIDLAIENGDKEIEKIYKYDGSDKYLRNYIQWWDSKIMDHMLKCESRIARKIFERLFKRKLLKQIHKKGINPREIEDSNLRNKFLNLKPEERLNFEKKISKIGILNCDADQVILNVVSIKNPTYRSPAGRISEDEIQVWSEKKRKPEHLKEIHWSVMHLAHVEDKQQYIEVYAPGEKWSGYSDSTKEKYLRRLNTSVEKILYE